MLSPSEAMDNSMSGLEKDFGRKKSNMGLKTREASGDAKPTRCRLSQELAGGNMSCGHKNEGRDD